MYSTKAEEFVKNSWTGVRLELQAVGRTGFVQIFLEECKIFSKCKMTYPYFRLCRRRLRVCRRRYRVFVPFLQRLRPFGLIIWQKSKNR